MTITPISPVTKGAIAPVGRPQSDALPDRAPSHQPEKAPVPPSPIAGTTTGIEFVRRQGVEQIKYFDKRTGQVIQSFPADQILDAVSTLIDFISRKAVT